MLSQYITKIFLISGRIFSFQKEKKIYLFQRRKNNIPNKIKMMFSFEMNLKKPSEEKTRFVIFKLI